MTTARERLPDRRASEVFDFEAMNLRFTASISRYPDGRVSELFCDKKCRDGEFRRLRYLTLKNVETPQKSEVSSKISKVGLGNRPSVLIGPNDPPVNILGGFKFPNAPAVDLSPLAESGETDMPVVASDWKPCAPSSPITDDLSIPAFLRRSK